MAESYDLIVRGGVVVNQDGEGRRDVGVTAGSRRSAIWRAPPPTRRSTPRACTCCPA
jgi:hypothetical protein